MYELARKRNSPLAQKKYSDGPRIIPRDKMPIGIELCKKNIAEFLEDARLISAQGRLSHAYISVQYALEELGKIRIFRNKLRDDQSDPLTITEEEAFRYHSGKTEEAWEFLDPKFKKIFDEGVWQEGMWQKGVWQEDVYADYETRQDCAFVDYYSDDWKIGRDIKRELLDKLINHVEEKLPQA